MSDWSRVFDLDLQLLQDAVLMMVAIFVLFLAASYFLFNPVRSMLEKRKSKIKDDLDEAAKAKEEAIASKDEYEAKLKDIEKEAEVIMADARKRALDNEHRIVEEAKAEAERIMERARTEAELEKQKAADEVKKQMVVLASMIAGKVVKASIDTTVQEAMVNDTLKEIGESTWLSWYPIHMAKHCLNWPSKKEKRIFSLKRSE